VCPANRARRSSGPVTTRDPAWLIVWTRSEPTLRLATISTRGVKRRARMLPAPCQMAPQLGSHVREDHRVYKLSNAMPTAGIRYDSLLP
jgi:hypothetical protein